MRKIPKWIYCTVSGLCLGYLARDGKCETDMQDAIDKAIDEAAKPIDPGQRRAMIMAIAYRRGYEAKRYWMSRSVFYVLKDKLITEIARRLELYEP